MRTDNPPKPSFSRGRKWIIGFNVVVVVIVVMAIVVMVNFLSSRHFHRYYLSGNARVDLSPRTVSFLRSITNDIQVTLYYDREAKFYNDIAELLKTYHAHDPRIHVETVDYNRNPGKAEEIKAKYKLDNASDRDLVIFDCGGRTKVVSGAALPEYTYQQLTNQPGFHFTHKLIGFNGEMMFTEALLAVTNPKPLQAYYLEGHGEHPLDDDTDNGYSKFMTNLLQNYVSLAPISLLGTNTVPEDCDLLIEAGARNPIPAIELDRIDHYLDQGGRFLVLFYVSSASQPTGLESKLARWGIQVGTNVVKDTEHSSGGSDIIVTNFTRSPVVNSLAESSLEMIMPREISRIEQSPQSSDGLNVEEIAYSGPHATIGDVPNRKSHPIPLIATVEKPAPATSANRRSTRILAVGDSVFLDNQLIGFAANRDFANNAAAWLLERNSLLQGIGPKSAVEYQLVVSINQMHTLQWILLGVIPGAILMLGGLVWVRRRK